MNRFVFSALMLLTATQSVRGQAEVEARKLALSAARGPQDFFLQALDADALLAQKVEAPAWAGLTEKQRADLRATTRQRFTAMLTPPRPVPAAIAWSETVTSGSTGGDVLVGISLAEKILKTRWRMKAEGNRWRVEEVILSDPGISLGQATLATLGPRPVRRQARLARARTKLLPWIALLAVIGLAVGIAAPRTPIARRRVLYVASAISAAVIAAGALVAAFRIAAEPYALQISADAEPWRRSQELAVAAERQGRVEEARQLSARAAALGCPPGPAAYELGLAAREGGHIETARRYFESALAAPAPAPGAARELASIALEQGRLSEAALRIGSYLAAAGPDPDALSLQAVIQANAGKPAEAVEAIARVRRLVGGGPKGAELEAKIRARAADAAGVVAALRPLVKDGGLDRQTLRSDPAYLPIATDPAWVRFLNEK